MSDSASTADKGSINGGEVPAVGQSTGSGGSNSGGADFTGSGGGGGAAVVAPPEMMVEKAFEAPVATGLYVWAANPKTGRVAMINSKTFQVTTVAAGVGPTYLAAIPGTGDKSIVINVLSSDATYLSQGADGKLDKRTYTLSKGSKASDANSWAISPDGRYAIAWTDVSRITNPDQFDGFQTISIIDLKGTAPAVQQSVGFRPRGISFSASPPRAFAVTDDGISVVDLETPANLVKLIKYPTPPAVTTTAALQVGDAGTSDGAADEGGGSQDPSSMVDAQTPPAPLVPGKADVSVTPDGSYAIVRRENSPYVDVIDLAKQTSWSWELSGPVTGLDLADTGQNAVAVLRGSSSVSVLPVPGTAQTIPSEIEIKDQFIGQVVIAPQGKVALLFTNALPIEKLTTLNIDDHSYNVIDLHAPVLAVFPSPTAQHAIVIHNSMKGQLSGKPGAFSVVPLSGQASPVIQTTDALPMSVAISPQGDRAIIPARNTSGAVYLTYLAHLSSGIVDRYELASPPTAAGFVGDKGQAFIAQDHPEGRVSFIDPDSGQVRTITGFELGASVIEWSSRDGGAL
jgi:hypothetical protein